MFWAPHILAAKTVAKDHLHRAKAEAKVTCFKCLSFVTARKQSLGQGNIFTSICDSVHKGGHAWQRGMCGEGECMVKGGMHGKGRHAW